MLQEIQQLDPNANDGKRPRLIWDDDEFHLVLAGALVGLRLDQLVCLVDELKRGKSLI